MRAHAATLPLLLACATLFPGPASAQISERLERCIPSPTFEREVSESNASRGAVAIAVDEVVFDGEIHMPDAERLALVRKLKTMRVKDDDDGLTEQQFEIEKWWKDNGYFRAELQIQALPTALDAAQQHVLLKIHVDEGAQYRLGGSVGFRSSDPEQPLVFPESRLMQTVKLSDGDVFSSLAIRDTLDALKQLYASHGYIDFVATPITEIDETTHHRVTLMMELDQEKQYRIGSVEVRATSPQVRAAIAAKVKTGDIFDRSALQDVLKQNASLLPPDVSERDVRFARDTKLGVVNLWFDLETCPQSPPK